MRELKFRAWIKDYIKESSIPKSMRADYGFPKMVTPLCVYSENGFEYQEGLGYRKISKKDYDFVLMQFTGLKDCEGREIYEGDIIESGVSKELSLKGHRGYVVFEDASFTVERRQHKVPYNHDKYLPYLDWPCEAFESCKVIGNVFEDGELLKE